MKAIAELMVLGRVLGRGLVFVRKRIAGVRFCDNMRKQISEICRSDVDVGHRNFYSVLIDIWVEIVAIER